ncbi:MAG: SHOCT domain-containing protein [Caldilineaceae bacterium]|nr:SHOCT domain-containing protein [Caldilineaceae bacterium]
MMFGGGMLLAWLLPIVLIVLVVGWLLNNGSSGRGDGANIFNQRPDKRPEDVLKERFARGEISQEEYEEMRRTLAQ